MSWHAVPSQHDEEQYTNHEEHYMHGMHHQEETGPAFFGATSSRESQQLMLRRAEHSESTEHIMPPQQRPAVYGRVKKDGEYNLSEYFHLPLSDVAKKFGICVTAFKKLCRKQGVMQWPHRTLRSIEKKIAALRAEQKFTKDDVAIEEQIAKLQARRESILSGRTSGLGDQEGAGVMLPSVSDDSSNSTTQSQASSPRTSLDISRVSFDKSLSLGEGTSSPALSTSSTRVSSQGTLTRIRSLNDVQKAAEKQAAAGQSSMAWGQNRSSSSSSSSSSNRGFTGRRAVSHESLFSLQNHQEAAHSFQSTSRPPVYSPNLKPFRQSGGYGGGSGAGGQPLGSVSPPMQGSGGGSAIGSPSSWHPISIGSSAVMRGGDSTGFQGLESLVEKGTGKGGQQTSRGMGSLSSSSAIDHSLKQLLNENSSLRTTIDTLVKEKVAWERRHREAQIHIEKYRAFAHDLEKELRGRKLLQEQQDALHEEEGKHAENHHHHHHHHQQQQHQHGMYGGGSVLLDHEEFLPSPFV